MQNRRNNINYLFEGEILCLKEISRRVGISYSALQCRRKRGWPATKIAPGIERKV
jgi:hypothetical protein